ncbi:MAG: HEAT repeat domain-containing protein, partial [Planctomycetales bacterium]|nr:HEAT repeat domain-containing protein [Planctomycetales bacterium]
RPGFVKPPVPRLGEATVAELVAELENPNSWWRETAHRLLFERQDSSAAPGLRRLLRDSESPQARLHALWSLEGLQVLADADLRTAMADADPHLREHAIRLIERRLGENAEWLPQVVAAAADEDARVRFQAAFTLGEVNDPRATSALATLVRRDAADALLRTAVLSSVSHSTVAFLMDLLQDQAFAETAPGLDMVSQLAFIVGARNVEEDIDRVLQQTAKQKRSVQRAIVGQLGAGLRRAKRDLSELAADDSRSGGRLVANLLDEAQQLAGDTAGALQQRLQAIELLNYQRFELAEGVLGKLLNIQEPPEIQLAAIRALTASGRADIAAMLLDKYPTLTPGVQAEVVDQLLRRADWVPAVFDAMLAGVVPASRVSESRRSVYLQSGTEAIRQRAEKLFSADAPGPRKDVLDEYQPALTLTGDSARGEQVFQKNCANCHRFGNQGIDVGPSLATVQNRSASQLLVNILDPSSEVSPDFLEYIVLSLDGQIATGVIVAENASSITLRQAEAKELTILREDIEEMRSSGKSLMPEGLEKVISPQQMADLLAYLLPAK